MVEGPSNEEMERLLQQGLKQRETMKGEMEEQARALVAEERAVAEQAHLLGRPSLFQGRSPDRTDPFRLVSAEC